jgi:BASS family bile acid:Na+ symporter
MACARFLLSLSLVTMSHGFVVNTKLPRRHSYALAPQATVAKCSPFLHTRTRVKVNTVHLSEEAAAESSPSSGFQKFSSIFSTLFPLWTALVALLGVFMPASFAWIPTSAFTALLGTLMLSMGITLSVEDFKRVAQKPGVMAVGFAGCYIFMPLLALALSRALKLSPALTAGMVLVGSINGGQASNLCTYIANGDVALSVLMTTVTTVGAIVMTPLISKVLLGALVPVDALGVAMSTIQVVLLPIVVGMTCNYKFPKTVKRIEPFSPIVGVLSTCVLVGSAVAQCSAPILAAGLTLQLAAMLLHVIGGAVSYFGLKKFYPETTCRTVAIETSMKSSAFGFLLAKLHFAEFAVRVVPAVSVVWMALVGSSLAVAFRFLPVPEGSD